MSFEGMATRKNTGFIIVFVLEPRCTHGRFAVPFSLLRSSLRRWCTSSSPSPSQLPRPSKRQWEFKIKTHMGDRRRQQQRQSMKVIDKINNGLANHNGVVFSFDFFPPRTEEGIENLYDRMDRMVVHQPAFCDITWVAGGSTSALTLDIANKMQNMICVETMMHLTCTNMPVEKLDDALDTVKTNGIQNILALRGDPPHGQDTFVTVEVRHIKAKYGDYFGITVAGYPGM
ncbi:unnamed protein product [Sphagnum jensenii]|uniref:Methylenetetrahydrofolate reductase (NAD(P)H) n=1 Tax=Sphagnum jensenii TaxID=128206 RepID=A0ABP1A2C0_9BRYO